MSENYWDRRRRYLNEDHKFRREQTERDVKILETKGNIDRLTGEITRREHSEQLKTLLDQMYEEKATALKEILACSSEHKDKWYEYLDSINLVGPDADVELKNLLEEVEKEKRLLQSNASSNQEAPRFRHSVENLLSPMERLVLEPIIEEQERLKRQYEKNEATKRSLKASALGLIVLYLGSLISTIKLYESTRSHF